MVIRSSFSQHQLFVNCPRCWYYRYVKKMKPVSDMSYAFGGNVVHDTLQKHYNGGFQSIDDTKEFFNNAWLQKQLDKSILKYKKDDYWLMVINGINVAKTFTSTELKIFYPDTVGYIDGVDSNKDELTDWKSSKRTKEKDEDYLKQLKFYSWLYKRKFDRLPTKVTVNYLRYIGTKGKLDYHPTEDDVKELKEWYYSIMEEMKNIKDNDILPDFKSSYNWHLFENLCTNENDKVFPVKLHIIGSTMQIDTVIPSLLGKQLEKKFSYKLKNAHWIMKNNPMANTTVRFWNPQKRILPLGFLRSLKKTLNDYAKHTEKTLNLEIVDHRQFNPLLIDMPSKFVNGRELRDYQQTAVNIFLDNKIGILEMGTGSGKTEIAIEIIRRTGFKTVFIVDKIELLRQTKKRIEDALGIEVGQIGSGVHDEKDITVATVQTLYKNINNFSKYLQSIRVAIFDETHKVAAKSYVRLSAHMLNAEYRLGMSGTAFRDDGNDMMIYSAVGTKIYDLSSKILIDKGWLVRPTINFIKDYIKMEKIKEMEQECKTGLINETEKYPDYYRKFIVDCKERNDAILKLVQDKPERKHLILVKLIDHGNILEELISGSKYLHGSTPTKEREQIFNDFVSGKIKVLISTISIFAEGIDIPSLDSVINAAANRGNVKTIQVLGRVLRTLEGKQNAYYYDFQDKVRFFMQASNARAKILREEEHEVNYVDFGER